MRRWTRWFLDNQNDMNGHLRRAGSTILGLGEAALFYTASLLHVLRSTYDPAAPETITVSYPGYAPFTARPVKIGEYCDKNPSLPVGMQNQQPETSRFLDALERKHRETSRQMADAISFASYREDGEHHV